MGKYYEYFEENGKGVMREIATGATTHFETVEEAKEETELTNIRRTANEADKR